MSEKKYAAVCGINCGNCDFLIKQCQGCGYVEGKPFWSTQIPTQICPLYDCCHNQKHLEHCGLCDDFPCRIFLDLRDPNMTDDEFQKSLKERQKALQRRAAVGTEQWLIEITTGKPLRR